MIREKNATVHIQQLSIYDNIVYNYSLMYILDSFEQNKLQHYKI